MQVGRWVGVIALLVWQSHSTALAHNVWFTPVDDAYLIQFGHKQAEGYPPERVTRLVARDAHGRELPIRRERRGQETAVIDGGNAALLLVEFDNGVHTRTANGSVPKPKNEVPGALESTRALKYGKYIATWNSVTTRSAGLALEIVPLVVALPRVNERLPVQVLLRGVPLAGAEIAWRGGQAGVTTDAQGKAVLPVKMGLNVYTTVHREPTSNDAQIDILSRESSFAFTAR